MRDIIVNTFLPGHIWVTYYLESKTTLEEAAFALAIGQSIGNPNAESKWETDAMIESHSAKILGLPGLKDNKGEVWIGFPLANIDWEVDGISQLLCMFMGGQMDIDIIEKCHLKHVKFPESWRTYPVYGITGMRDVCRHYTKPFLGGIVKPKTGIDPETLLEMTKAMIGGGVNFIKEDEILGNPAICPFKKRVDLIAGYLDKNGIKNIVYTFCANGDPAQVYANYDYVTSAKKNGINVGVHVNVWSGLGVYKDMRKKGKLFLHYQKSGDRVFTCKDHKYHIDWNVLCYLAAICGVDSIHAGMLGGYLSDDEAEMIEVVKTLRSGNVLPALSCGMTPDHVAPITEKIGVDWMANVGGFIHSDPSGTEAGCLKMRKAIDAL